MDIFSQLEKEHSKFNTTRIVNYIGNDRTKFKQLMNIFFEGPYRITQRAAWPMSFCVDRHPELIQPYLAKLIDQLEETTPVAVKRNTLRLLQNLEIPESLSGKAVSICFSYLEDNKEPVAVKVFAMTVIFNITKVEHELGNELRILLEDQWQNGTAGFRSRAGKILKKLESIHN